MVAKSLAYYRSGLCLLRHVEARQPTHRRFGEQADALWSQFQGELSLSDRIDLLLREADAQWPGSFGARTVFHLSGVAEDESFGSEWGSLDGQDADRLWKSIPAGVETPAGVLGAIAEAWGLSLKEIPAPEVAPDVQFVVVGPSAVAALLSCFVGDETLDWAAQVVLVATPDAHRQIAAATGAILRSTKNLRIVAAGVTSENGERVGCDDLTDVTSHLKGKNVRLVAAEDAAPLDVSLARQLAGVS